MFGSLLFLLGAAWAADDFDIDVKVKGMVCSFCIQGVEKKLLTEDSIEKFNVDIEDSSVFIWLKKEKSLADERIKKMILDAGYDVQQINRPVTPVTPVAPVAPVAPPIPPKEEEEEEEEEEDSHTLSK